MYLSTVPEFESVMNQVGVGDVRLDQTKQPLPLMSLPSYRVSRPFQGFTLRCFSEELRD